AGRLPLRVRLGRRRSAQVPRPGTYVPVALGERPDVTATVYSLARGEPVCRGGDPGKGLAATVEDPLWMLARQRQFGELTGEDAGSPVQVAFVQTETPLDSWRPIGGDLLLPYTPATD